MLGSREEEGEKEKTEKSALARLRGVALDLSGAGESGVRVARRGGRRDKQPGLNKALTLRMAGPPQVTCPTSGGHCCSLARRVAVATLHSQSSIMGDRRPGQHGERHPRTGQRACAGGGGHKQQTNAHTHMRTRTHHTHTHTHTHTYTFTFLAHRKREKRENIEKREGRERVNERE